MPLVRAGLGENLDAPVSQLVILRGEGILIHANFPDGGFRRKLAAGESVNVDFPAIWPGGRARQCLELRRQLVGVIGKRIQVLSFQHQGAGVVLRLDADT